MCDKKKNNLIAPTLRCNKPKRASTATVDRSTTHFGVVRDRASAPRFRPSKNTTIIGDLDATMSPSSSTDEGYRQNVYGKFLRSFFQDCVLHENIERESTEIDMAMGQLATRFERSVGLLDKTSARLKDITFSYEQQRLLELKQKDCSTFYETAQKGNHNEAIQKLTAAEESCLNQLNTKNVDFGYNKDTGHQQLLDAVDDCLKGFEEIKKKTKLDSSKLTQYEKCQNSSEEMAKDMLELENLKKEFELKFPNFSEKLLIDVSDKISKLAVDSEINNDTDEGSLRN